jgi:hypothetical protein
VNLKQNGRQTPGRKHLERLASAWSRAGFPNVVQGNIPFERRSGLLVVRVARDLRFGLERSWLSQMCSNRQKVKQYKGTASIIILTCFISNYSQSKPLIKIA